MKKVVAIILAGVLVLGLIACASTSTSTSPSAAASGTAPKASESASAPASAAASASAGSASAPASPSGTFPGYITDKADHAARKTYTLCYAMPAETSMHDGFLAGFKQFEKKFNCKIVSSNANSNNDAFLDNLEVMAPKVDGFFVDSQFAIHNRVKEVLTELKKPYVAFFEALFDDKNQVVAPCVVSDGYTNGKAQADWVAENYKKYFGDIDPAQICVLDLYTSTYVEFANRAKGATEEFKKKFPTTTLYQHLDMTGKGVGADAAYNMITPIITTQPNIKYWWITCANDGWGQGAARAVESAKMEKKHYCHQRRQRCAAKGMGCRVQRLLGCHLHLFKPEPGRAGRGWTCRPDRRQSQARCALERARDYRRRLRQ